MPPEIEAQQDEAYIGTLVSANLLGFIEATEGVTITWVPTKTRLGGRYFRPNFEIDRDYFASRTTLYGSSSNIDDLFAEVGTEFVIGNRSEFRKKYGSKMYNFWQELLYPGRLTRPGF